MKKKATIELTGDHAENIARMAPYLTKSQQKEIHDVLYGMMKVLTRESENKEEN